MKIETPNRIIISRTDSIGDVMLTLPIAGILKKEFPDCEILFLGRTYTKDVVKCSVFVDGFVDYAELEKLTEKEQIQRIQSLNADTIIHVFPRKNIAKLAKKLGIKNRIGTSHRLYHWLTCNRLVAFSRKKSDLHEAELNTKLLKPIIDKEISYSLTQLSELAGFANIAPLREELKEKLDNKRLNIILHPKSKGSAREWGLENFVELINLLPEEKFNIIITGTQEEGNEIAKAFDDKIRRNIQNLCGKMNLSELISFVSQSDAMIACSTGPLHIASIDRKSVV